MTDWVQHHYPPEERRAFVDFINQLLADDSLVGSRLPINPDNDDFFQAVGDGLILCKMLNKCVRGCLDEKKLTIKDNLNQFEKAINCDLFLSCCKDVGVKVVSIGSSDLIAGKPHLVLGIVWQVIKKGMFSQVFINHPELILLLEPGQKHTELNAMGEEEVVLRWVNWQLSRDKADHKISNFTSDIQDGLVYCKLFHALGLMPDLGKAKGWTPMERAVNVLEAAKTIKASKFVTPQDILDGNARLNFAFVANIFAQNPQMPSLGEEYMKVYANEHDLKKKATELSEVKQQIQKTAEEKTHTEVKLQEQSKEMTALKQENERLKHELAAALQAKEVASEAAASASSTVSDRELQLERMLRTMESEVSQLRDLLQLKIAETEQANTDAAQSREAAAKLQQTFSQVTSRLDEVKQQLNEKEKETQDALTKAKNAQTAFDELNSTMNKALKEGSLRKQGRGFKSWKRRFFSLRGRLLFYFADEASAKAKKPLGVVYLDEYRISTNPKPDEQPLLMVLEHKTLTAPAKGAQFLMEAADANDLQQWIAAMQKSMTDPTFEKK